MKQKIIILFLVITLGLIGVYFFTTYNKHDEGESIFSRENIEIFNKETLLEGSWRDNNDKKDITTYLKNNTYTESYDGKIIATGEWRITFVKDKVGVQYQLIQKDSKNNLVFSLNSITPETLDLTYLDRGLIHTYTKIK